MRELPIFEVKNVHFYVDVDNKWLVDKSNPKNRYLIRDMIDEGNCYKFEARIPKGSKSSFNNFRMEVIKIPQMCALDPIRMSELYGIPVDEIKLKSDFEVMVNPLILQQRVEKGILPTLDIAGKIFTIDLELGYFRPMNDYTSLGIPISNLWGYYTIDNRACIIPYDLQKKQIEIMKVDMNKLYPPNIVLVQFPSEEYMDPVGFCKKVSHDPKAMLKMTGIQTHFVARRVDWKDYDVERNQENAHLKFLPAQMVKQNWPNYNLRKGGRSKKI